MKVRISYTINVSDDYRRAISHYYGYPHIATRQEVKDFVMTHGEQLDDEIMARLQMDEENDE